MAPSEFRRHTVFFCAVVAMLAGCGSGGAQTGFAPSAPMTTLVSPTTHSQPASFITCHWLYVHPPSATVKRNQRIELRAELDIGVFPHCHLRLVLAKWTASGGHLLSKPRQRLADFWASKLGSYNIVATYDGISCDAPIGQCGQVRVVAR